MVTRAPVAAYTEGTALSAARAVVVTSRSRLGYEEGDTNYSEHSVGDPLIHDLENVGDSVLRFVTVELLG